MSRGAVHRTLIRVARRSTAIRAARLISRLVSSATGAVRRRIGGEGATAGGMDAHDERKCKS